MTEKEGITHFRDWETSLAPEIMAYFDNPAPNAYTESLNNFIRVTNRLREGLQL